MRVRSLATFSNASRNSTCRSVRGMQSELVDEAAARDFVAQAGNARYVDIGGAGHMVAGDRNDVFSQAVIDFFDEQARATAVS